MPDSPASKDRLHPTRSSGEKSRGAISEGVSGGERGRGETENPQVQQVSVASKPCDSGQANAIGPSGPAGGLLGSVSGNQVQPEGSVCPTKVSSEGMDVERLLQQLVDLTDSMFADGFLDEQFTQLQQLQDANNPDFVGEVVTLFFEDSEKLLDNLTASLEQEPIDYKKIDSHVHQFKGSSSSIGAQRVKAVCIKFRTCCEEESKEGCWQALRLVKQEFYLVKTKLEALLQVEQQILAAGGTLPFME